MNTLWLPEWGQSLLMATALLGVLQLGVLHQPTRFPPGAWAWAQRWPVWQWGVSILLALVLMIGFLNDDFSWVVVAQHSHAALPVFYKACAWWGSHEGSMLFWWMVLQGWSVWALRSCGDDASRQGLMKGLAWISIGLLGYLLFASNPFLRYLPRIPLSGADLNPLLQDPGMVWHPPCLYIGYVGAAVPYVWAMVALYHQRLSQAWAEMLQRWVAASLAFLSVGIVLGSWWAYRELGWGGWWFWDPVENAALMPWLAQVALLHALQAYRKRGLLPQAVLLLALLGFPLSLLGAFLVRSGVLVSVHAFAVDPQRGLFLLFLFAAWTLMTLLFLIWRGPGISQESDWQPASKEGILVWQLIGWVTLLATVLVGTLYPLVLQVLGLDKISVGAPYFNALCAPVMGGMLGLLGISFGVGWQQDQWRSWWKSAVTTLPLAAGCAACLWWGAGWPWSWSAWGWSIPACWVLSAQVRHLVVHGIHGGRQLGGVLAHTGLAVAALGVVAATHASVSREWVMQRGEVGMLGPYRIELVDVHRVTGPNYLSQQADVRVNHHHLAPEQRFYPASNMPLAKTAIWIRPQEDVYVALGQRLDAQHWSMRVYRKAGVRWIWWGGVMIALGVLMRVGLGRGRGRRRP